MRTAPKSAPRVLVGRLVGVQTTLEGRMIGSVFSGIATHVDAREEVATHLEESSSLVGDETLRAGDVGPFRRESLNA